MGSALACHALPVTGLKMNEWAFKGRLISVRVVDTPLGRREIVEHPGAVAVLALDREGRVLVVRQRREAVGKSLWEIPAGKLEPGEAPEEAARRELQEETGLFAKTLVPLGAIYPTPGYSNELIHLFLARGIKGIAEARSEISQVRYLPPRELSGLARAGEGDGKTLAALALLQLWEQSSEEP